MVVAGAAVGAVVGVADVAAGLEAPTISDFEACFEQALTTSSNPRIAYPAIVAIANFCCRDQDESVVPENALLVAWLADFLSFVLRSDFQIVDILSPPLRLAQSEVRWQENVQTGRY